MENWVISHHWTYMSFYIFEWSLLRHWHRKLYVIHWEVGSMTSEQRAPWDAGLTTNNQRLSNANHATLETATSPAQWWTYGARREGLTSWAATNIHCSHIWKAKGNGQLQENLFWCGIKENTIGKYSRTSKEKKKNDSIFPSFFCLLRPPFPLSLYPKTAGNTVEWKKKRKSKPCLSKSTAQVHNQPNQVYAYWRAVPLKAVLSARGVWVSSSQCDNKNHCCVCLDSLSKSDPPLWSKCPGLSSQ